MELYSPDDHLLVVCDVISPSLTSILDACCLLPIPFYPTKVVWINNSSDVNHIREEIDAAVAYYTSDLNVNAQHFEVSHRLSDCSVEFVLDVFKQFSLQGRGRVMVVSSDERAEVLARLVPVFCGMSRLTDHLLLAHTNTDNSKACLLEEVRLPRLYQFACKDPGKTSEHELIKSVSDRGEPSSLIVRPDAQVVEVNNQVIGLSPLLFAFYFWLARRRKQCEDPKFNHGGFVRYSEEGVTNEFLAVYRHYCDELSSHYEKAHLLLDKTFPKNYFLEKVSLIRSALREVLGEHADYYFIHAVGKRKETVHGLLLPPELIRFER